MSLGPKPTSQRKFGPSMSSRIKDLNNLVTKAKCMYALAYMDMSKSRVVPSRMGQLKDLKALPPKANLC